MDNDLFATDIDKRSVVEIVIDKIKELLIRDHLKPGDMLPSENELSQSIGVGRGSLREAMKILSSFGIVEIKRGDGTYIASSASQKIFDPLLFNLLIAKGNHSEIIELRRLIEIGIVELIIKNATDQDLTRLEEQYEDLRNKMTDGIADLKILSNSDLKFHYVMASITKNQMVESIYRFIAEIFAPTMHGDYALEPHELILEALHKRDLDLAIKAIEKHTEVWRGLMEKDRRNEGR
jgi:DNA-binding FadR family transcriptional regulator